MAELPASVEALAGLSCQRYPRGTGKLAATEVEEMLRLVEGWTLGDDVGSISREWRLEDFVSAIGLIDRVAALAETEDHHPDIRLWAYRNLRVDLTTHDSGGLTLNDFIMAAKIDRLATTT